MTRVLITALTVALFALPALADLCPKCRGKMFPMAIGKCGQCGGMTPSIGYRLCAACGQKLGQCQVCRMALGGAPAPASQPATQADEQAKALKAKAENLVFVFANTGPADKPFYHVTLSAPDFMLDEPKDFQLIERITAEQAGKIVDLLSAGGWLKKPMLDSGYTLVIRGAGDPQTISLGFDLKMLRLLDSVAAAVDGDAAKAMKKLIARLSGHRKQWEAEENKAGQADVPVLFNDNGGFTVGGKKAAGRDELIDQLKALPGDHATTRLQIRTSKNTPWAEIQAVLNAATKLGFQDIVLSTDAPAGL